MSTTATNVIKDSNEFMQNFEEFKEFLNSPVTQYTMKTLVGRQGEQVLELIKKRFDELGLNNALE